MSQNSEDESPKVRWSKVKCPYCGIELISNNLGAHLRSTQFKGHDQANIPQLYNCKPCNKSFPHSTNYKRHMAAHRSPGFKSFVNGVEKTSTPPADEQGTDDLMPRLKRQSSSTRLSTNPSRSLKRKRGQDAHSQIQNNVLVSETQPPVDDATDYDEFLESTPPDSATYNNTPTRRISIRAADAGNKEMEVSSSAKSNQDEPANPVPANSEPANPEPANPEPANPEHVNEVCNQWKHVRKGLKNIKFPAIFLKFLQGQLWKDETNIPEAIAFRSSENGKKIGLLLPSLFMLEYCLCKLDVNEVLQLYQLTLEDQLHPLIMELNTAIAMQQLQEHLRDLNPGIPIPPILKSHLDYSPLLNELESGHESLTLHPVDETFILQIESILRRIVKMDESLSKVDQVFCFSLIQRVLNEYRQQTVRSVYECMIMNSLDLGIGDTNLYIYAVNDLGIKNEINIHDLNASRHGIQKADPNKVDVVKVSASGKEVQVFLDLVYCSNPTHLLELQINYAVYEMAEKLKIPNIRNYLFRNKRINFDAYDLDNRVDIFHIAVKLEMSEFFTAITDLRAWLPSAGVIAALNRLSKPQVLWVLEKHTSLYTDELDLYYALAMRSRFIHGLDPVAKEHLQNLVQPEQVISLFRDTYKDCLCLLDLRMHFRTLLKEGLVETPVIAAAYKMLRKEAVVNPHPALRNR